MVSETDGPESGADASAVAVDQAAIALRLGGASRERAEAILNKQEALIDSQKHQLHRQFEELRYSLWEKKLGILLRVAMALTGLAVAVALGAMVWNAYHYEGLIIEVFSVPSDMAERGMSGEVVASRMLDKISTMQAHVNTVRAPNSFTNNWGEHMEVHSLEIGMSLDQLERYLREKFGHPIHVRGDVVRSASGISVTARAGVQPGKSFSGTEDGFDTLLQGAAESVYARTQPYRYGVYLLQNGRIQEGTAFFADAVRSGSPSERAWAYTGWYTALGEQGRQPEANEKAHTAVELYPNFAFGWTHLGESSLGMGHYETALQGSRNALRLLEYHLASDTDLSAVPRLLQEDALQIDVLLGDYAAGIGEVRKNQSFVGINQQGTTRISLGQFAKILIGDHDLAAARRIMAGMPTGTFSNLYFLFEIAVENEDWPRVLQLGPELDTARARTIAAGEWVGTSPYPPTTIWPYLAYAEAMTGHFAAAHAQIDETPGDCDLCLRMRGKIDAAQENYEGAAFWFARAAELAPSIPFSFADFGKMVLAEGDYNGAIAQFKIANQKGPHFADPLEMWGEVLMLEKHPQLALAKFEEALQFAPNWGRLHIKFGEALFDAGKVDEADMQFATAAGLNLTVEDRAELARVSVH